MPDKKHIVIIGAGFAGLRLARILNNHPGYLITLIDKNNYHQFQPLLYQVATANLDASNISFPLRTIFKKSKNVRVKIAEVIGIYPEENKIETSIESIYYDYLVVATGAETNYFGNNQVERYAFPMKSTVEALQLKNQLIKNFEDAAISKDIPFIERLLTIVVVGAGPTGIELSGALAEMKRDSLPKEYPELNFNKMKIYLLEGTNEVLGSMSTTSSIHSKKYLEEMGVLVKTNTLVKDYDGQEVILQNGKIIPSAMVIWTAGVKGNIPQGINKKMINAVNRVKVDDFNKVLDSKNIFALGDIAFMESADYPKGHPQLASVAIDQAKNLAMNFIRVAKGEVILEYKHKNKGAMATIGRNKAVVDLIKPRISFRGFLAWFVWMGIHLFLLIGFKNRLIVFINWAYKYFMRNQSLSLLFLQFLRKNNTVMKQETKELVEH
ncbi:MAG: NAD(P)/FAD-dependent oxidoreductase [Bacteroidota bacterium]